MFFPDIPPITPPISNFMMTQIFEVTKKGSIERVLEWDSETEVDLRVQLKLLNNYPKYFQITTCKNNEIYFKMKNRQGSRIFETSPYSYQIFSIPSSCIIDKKKKKKFLFYFLIF